MLAPYCLTVLSTLRQPRYLGLFALMVVVATVCGAGRHLADRPVRPEARRQPAPAHRRPRPAGRRRRRARPGRRPDLDRPGAEVPARHRHRQLPARRPDPAARPERRQRRRLPGDHPAADPRRRAAGRPRLPRPDRRGRQLAHRPGRAGRPGHRHRPAAAGRHQGRPVRPAARPARWTTSTRPQQAARLTRRSGTATPNCWPASPAPPACRRIPAPDLSNPAGGAEEPQHAAYVVQWYLFGLLALAAPFVMAAAERRRDAAEAAATRAAEPRAAGRTGPATTDPGRADRQAARPSWTTGWPAAPDTTEPQPARPSAAPEPASSSRPAAERGDRVQPVLRIAADADLVGLAEPDDAVAVDQERAAVGHPGVGVEHPVGLRHPAVRPEVGQQRKVQLVALGEDLVRERRVDADRQHLHLRRWRTRRCCRATAPSSPVQMLVNAHG